MPVKPPPITAAEHAARIRRIERIARTFGFVGRIEYHHLFSQSGGAQYGLARQPDDDRLIVFAEAFQRDADPTDFSLEAILAHECGHQRLSRHPRLSKQVAGIISPATEEILASVVGAILCPPGRDRETLLAKATVELLNRGETAEIAVKRIQDLWNYLEGIL
jgi:hypothetical protein